MGEIKRRKKIGLAILFNAQISDYHCLDKETILNGFRF
jgi:hypothetical protein